MSKIAFSIMLKSIILACTYLIHQLNPIVHCIYLKIPPPFKYLFIHFYVKVHHFEFVKLFWDHLTKHQ